MAERHSVYLEVGTKRVFATAVDWPGWSRSGRDVDSALQALVEYGPRYGRAVGGARHGFRLPSGVGDLDVVERLKGDASTDFGVPGKPASTDDRPIDDAELRRLQSLVRAAWRAFDRSAKRYARTTLSTGPRGGGRSVAAMIEHVRDAEGGYLASLGWPTPRPKEAAEIRSAILRALADRAHGEPPPPSKRRSPLWSPTYGARRTAWHALDHAWEIEDRASH
jgi:hypothetical protein